MRKVIVPVRPKRVYTLNALDTVIGDDTYEANVIATEWFSLDPMDDAGTIVRTNTGRFRVVREPCKYKHVRTPDKTALVLYDGPIRIKSKTEVRMPYGEQIVIASNSYVTVHTTVGCSYGVIDIKVFNDGGVNEIVAALHLQLKKKFDRVVRVGNRTSVNYRLYDLANIKTDMSEIDDLYYTMCKSYPRRPYWMDDMKQLKEEFEVKKRLIGD